MSTMNYKNNFLFRFLNSYDKYFLSLSYFIKDFFLIYSYKSASEHQCKFSCYCCNICKKYYEINRELTSS